MKSKQLPLTVLLVCENTVTLKYRSGIQRVVVETARAMAGRCNLRLVKWDDRDGQLRDLDSRDLEKLFGDDIPGGLTPHPACQRVAFRFVDTIENPHNSWLLYMEVPHEIEKGPQKLAAMRAQCREVGVRSALIFYDLIPVLEREYTGARPKHLDYMIEAVLCDRIFPISQFSGEDLLAFLNETSGLSEAQLDDLRRRIIPAPLGEYREGESWGLARFGNGETRAGEPRMIMVGTVEPRKQQVQLLKGINDARKRFPELNRLHIDLFGSLYPDCAEALQTELKRNPLIAYHRYASDEAIERAYAQAWFSAFVSKHEGYGLPIVESLRHGVPCLTASFGAMGEVGADGGCLLVDTLNVHEMIKGVRRMLSDEALSIELKQEIANRPKRSWGDYVTQIVEELGSTSKGGLVAEEALVRTVRKVAEGEADAKHRLNGVSWTITADPRRALGTDRKKGDAAVLLLLKGKMSSGQLAAAAQADVIAAPDPKLRGRVIAAVSQAGTEEMLPTNAFFGSDAIDRAGRAAIAESRVRGTALAMRNETAMKRRLLEAYGHELPHSPAKLAIVLSTYNRGSFVEHNVEWVLGQIDRDQLSVRCIVVDNASTDDTHARLQRFVGHPNFTLIENANNVGMLGNLRVCAAGLFAPYVWLTGDDDFILPGRIQAVLDAIDQSPGVPLMVHNFAVYHRASFGPNDHASHFLNEMHMLAPHPAPEGIRPVNEIAGEHDNLFTAIYPLVFRSDVLATCFDHPFTGTPFGDLIECVPTSRLLLGTYRYTEALWFADVGIVGNAHNSWSSHRPRWHLVLMPLVLQLARDAGVEAKKVWRWLELHKNLFDEAVDICKSTNETAHLQLPDDLAFAEWCFRQEIEMDEQLRLAVPTRVEHWSTNVEQRL